MRLFLSLLCLCLAAQEKPEFKRPKETLALIDRARALPPEFSADVLLKLATSPTIPDTKWKRELIEEAFTVGAHAPLPYPRIVYGGGVESRWNQEYHRNGLEALTLEGRAVEAMLPIDPLRAASMFQDIVFPTLTQEACDEPAVGTFETYYDTTAKVFTQGFTAKQRQKEEDLQFLEGRIARMQSPLEVPRVLSMIFALKVGAEQRKRLLTAYAVALDGLNGGDRAYGAVEPLVVPGNTPEIASSSIFLTALRGYIVRHVSGPRCSEYTVAGKLPGSVITFNGLAARVDPTASWLQPITAEEAKPSKDAGTYPPQRVFASKRAWDTLAALKWLDHGDTDPVRPWTAEERTSPEWNNHFLDTLKLIEGWKVEEEKSPEEYLINVAQTYAALAAKAPPGPARENVIGRYLNFLETRYAETANRNLWFTQVQTLLNRVGRTGTDLAWVREHFARSGNPVIALYAQLPAE